MTYTFTFDARYCSGCKACQAACKDKNHLPSGVLLRRVIEVSGGSWQQCGDTWNNSVFAYNLSIACNHCQYPKCAGVCPTNAYTHREDGIVHLDTSKCVGCGYCAWVCPYDAPHYNPEAGHMTKCDFCLDNLEQGLDPACVAACPLRVLHYSNGDIPDQAVALWDTPSEQHPFPLPGFSHTQPHLAITPHPAMSRLEEKAIGNREEIQPRAPSAWEDLPLLLFTLFTQLAVGGFWVMNSMFSTLWALVADDNTWLRLLPSLIIGGSLGIGMLASFAHLGTKKNAWRVFAHLRKSSLSREILFTVLFGLGWLINTLLSLLRQPDTIELLAITSILGLGLIYNMSQVYRFPAAPGWNTWRTNIGFAISAFLLGIAAMSPILSYESTRTGIQLPVLVWNSIHGGAFILLLAQVAITRKRDFSNAGHIVRAGFIAFGVLLNALLLLRPDFNSIGMNISIFLAIAIEETIGRWLFYQSRLGDG